MPYLGKTPSQATRQRYYLTASGGETSISGTMTTGGTLTFNDGEFVDVKLNGVSLVAGTDYNTTTANTIGGLSALAANDQVEIVVYDTFSVFGGNVDGDFTISNGTLAADRLDVDNIRIDGNTISSTDTNGDIDVTPNGSGSLHVTNSGSGDALIVESTDSGDTFAPDIAVYRNTSSPADDDGIGLISFRGRNDASEDVEYAQIVTGTGDVSDGTENGNFAVKTMVDGTLDSRLTIANDGNVGIGNSSPSHLVDATVSSGSATARFGTTHNSGDNDGTVIISNGGSGDAMLRFDYEGSNTDRARISVSSSGQQLEFYTAGDNERMRIDSSGNVLVSKTAANNTTQGITMYGTAPGNMSLVRDQGSCLVANRLTNDGDIMVFRKDGSTVGAIITASSYLAIGDDCGLLFNNANPSFTPFNAVTFSNADNSIDLGVSNARFDDIFATNSTIQTSDQNEKEQIASLTTAEITAAKAISKLFKTFKWQDKVAAKGDAARTHAGVIAQEVQTAMTDAGLDAADYAFWCSDTWWETSTDVPAVEADEEAGIEARVAYTRIDTYDTAEEAPEGATQRTRLGIRYPELLAFIGAATEQRLADLETRVTALEDA